MAIILYVHINIRVIVMEVMCLYTLSVAQVLISILRLYDAREMIFCLQDNHVIHIVSFNFTFENIYEQHTHTLSIFLLNAVIGFVASIPSVVWYSCDTFGAEFFFFHNISSAVRVFSIMSLM